MTISPETFHLQQRSVSSWKWMLYAWNSHSVATMKTEQTKHAIVMLSQGTSTFCVPRLFWRTPPIYFTWCIFGWRARYFEPQGRAHKGLREQIFAGLEIIVLNKCLDKNWNSIQKFPSTFLLQGLKWLSKTFYFFFCQKLHNSVRKMAPVKDTLLSLHIFKRLWGPYEQTKVYLFPYRSANKVQRRLHNLCSLLTIPWIHQQLNTTI